MKKISVILIIIISLFFLVYAQKTEILKEALYYSKLDKNYIKCELCPNYCLLGSGETGTCGVRKNIEGTLYSLVYNKPISIHIDPIEKKPLYHFLPGTQILSLATVGCNLRCIFCQNWEISQSRPKGVRAYEKTPEEIIEITKENNCQSIAFTYTEPTIFYEYMLDIAKLAKQKNIKTVWVTCGYINEKPLRELCQYLDAANIDLKGFSEEFYQTYTTGRLQPVLDCLKTAKQESLFFEITNLVIPDANDDPEIIRGMCNWIGENLGFDYPLHFSRFFPNYQLLNRPATPLKTLETAKDIALESGIQFVYIGNITTEYEDTFCPICEEKIIDRSGYLIKSQFLENGKCRFCGSEISGVFE